MSSGRARGEQRTHRTRPSGRDHEYRAAAAMVTELVLGIETSCDETAAAVVAGGRTIVSSTVATQAERHAPYGGVVPEIASRLHVELITDVIARALLEAG